MSKVKIEFDLAGCEKMVKALDEMGVDVQPAINRAAIKAIAPVKAAITDAAPESEGGGTLKAAIYRKREKTKFSGKRVYEVTFNRSYNSVLQKPIKKPGMYGGKSDKGYYPASMEYGFLTAKTGGGIQFRSYTRGRGRKREKYIVVGVESRKVEGKHFMKKGAEQTEAQAKQIMIQTTGKELDKLWRKAQHE